MRARVVAVREGSRGAVHAHVVHDPLLRVVPAVLPRNALADRVEGVVVDVGPVARAV